MSSRSATVKKAGTSRLGRSKDIKAEFRREDAALARAGRAREVLEKNVAALGIDPKGKRPRLLSINGVRFRT